MQAVCSWKVETAALTVMCPLVSPKIIDGKVSGRYFVPIARESPCSTSGNDAALAANLWAFSEKLLAEKGWASM